MGAQHGSGAREPRAANGTGLLLKMACFQGSFGAVAHLKFGKHVVHMMLHGALGDAERRRNAFVALSCGEQVQDFEFTRGQRFWRLGQ